MGRCGCPSGVQVILVNSENLISFLFKRQLGFRSGQAVGGSYFGQTVPNKYAMEDVQCTGSEDFLRVKCTLNGMCSFHILLSRIANIRPITPAASTMEQEYSVIHDSYS